MTRTRGMWTVGAVVVAVVAGAAGCSGDDDVTPPASASDVAAERASSEPSSPATVTPSPVLDDAAFVPGLSDAVMVQTTPVSGGGERPMLAWDAVDGARDYVVMVHTDADAPYWSWATSETQVRLGLTDRPDTAPGPRVAEGMTWVVVARDGDGLPIATSPRRPIAP